MSKIRTLVDVMNEVYGAQRMKDFADTGISPRSYGENMRMTKKKRKVRKSGK